MEGAFMRSQFIQRGSGYWWKNSSDCIFCILHSHCSEYRKCSRIL